MNAVRRDRQQKRYGSPVERVGAKTPDGATIAGRHSNWKSTLTLAAGIFILALIVRVVYLIDSADYPAYTIPIVDARYYDDAARQWTSGGGMGSQFFWQPFFYPLFLSLVYSVNGGSVLGAKVVQIIVGALTCALTAVLGRRLFGRGTGLTAGIITALYGPLIFYEAELLAVGWAAFWSVALLLLFLVAERSRSPLVALTLGVVAALSALTRPTFLPFLCVACLWLVWTWTRARPGWLQLLQSCAALAIGFAAIVTPVVIKNAQVTGYAGFLPLLGGVNVYIGNHPDPAKVARTTGMEWTQLLREPEAEGITDPVGRQAYFYGKTRAYALQHPVACAGRIVWKGLQFMSSRELPRSTNIYTVREWSAVQSVLTWKTLKFGFPFGVLLPLAVVGAVTCWRKMPVPLALFVTLYPAAVIVVFVTARYRIPLVPALAILAAAGGGAIVQRVRARRWGQLAVVAAGCIAVVVAGSLPGPFWLEREPLSLYAGVGLYHLTRGDTRRAMEFYHKELQLHPDSASAHTELGGIYSRMGQLDQALEHFGAVRRLKPHLSSAHGNYGLTLVKAGRLEEGLAAIRQAIAIEPTNPVFHIGLGVVYSQQGKLDKALAEHREAVRLAPGDPVCHFNLGVTLAKTKDYDRAIAAFMETLNLNRHDVAARYMLASALEDAGRYSEARAEFRRLFEAAPDYRDTRARLRRFLQRPPAE